MKFNLFKQAAFVLLQCLFATALLAQIFPLPKQWDKRFGGSDYDQLGSLQQTTDGGYILGGSSQSNIGGDVTQASNGGSDYWVVKTDANGLKQWDKRFGGNNLDQLNSIEQTTDGGYILGGYSYSGISGDKTENSRGGYDYWIVKIDSNGIKEWDKTFGGSGDDYFQSLQQTINGGYILGGYSYSDISGEKTEATRGKSDYWIVKIDANGNKQWDKRFGGDDYDYLLSLQQKADGSYILGGYSYSHISGDKSEPSRGSTDYWVINIDVNGNKLWDKDFGGTAFEILNSVEQTTDGGYILGGSSGSGISGDKTEASRGGNDYWIVKIDSSGLKQWDNRFGGNLDEHFTSLQVTTDGGYLLGGYSTSGINGDRSQSSWGAYDYWIVKTNVTGAKQWDSRFGGIYGDNLVSLKQTTDEGFILGGYTTSKRGADITQSARGTADYWIVKIGCPPNTEITASGRLNICQTESVQLRAYQSESYKYQWTKNKQIIRGATDSNFTVFEPGVYRVVVYTNSKCADVSKPITVFNSCEDVENKLTIFPNPSHGIVTASYQSNSSGNVQLSVYDKTGKLMFTKTENVIKGKNAYQLNLSYLINGMYNLQLSNSSGQSQVKFVIQK